MSKKDKHVQAVVVGAGAGGGVVAKELAVNGIQVVLMERGGWANYDDKPNDELTCMRGPMERPLAPDRNKNPRVRIIGEGDKQQIVPDNGWGTHIGNTVGSGLVSYGAMAWRFMPQDFVMKT